MIQFSRYLPENLRSIVDNVIERNGFFAHPENILLSMLFDTRRHIRELSLRRILKARKSVDHGIRTFKPPKIYFSAEDYVDIIIWNECQVTSPPILSHISNEELEARLHENNLNLQIIDFPCHTQAVERCVKIVTEASRCVIGENSRDGFIRNRIESRSKMPSFGHKNQFVLE
jgi:hypothetical protein